jgi:hypothetical protein
MHWVIQSNLFKPDTLARLMHALRCFELPYSLVEIPAGGNTLLPDVAPRGKVFACGALKMAAICRAKGWSPGSFLNANFDSGVWEKQLPQHFLNAGAEICLAEAIAFGASETRFLRPALDNKLFDGQVLSGAQWRALYLASSHAMAGHQVLIAPVRQIQREYRVFMVQARAVTCPLYKMGGKPLLSTDVESDVIDYANALAQLWQPAEAYVIDIGRTEAGLKFIEFNNINSASFYACDEQKIVAALELAFA